MRIGWLIKKDSAPWSKQVRQFIIECGAFSSSKYIYIFLIKEFVSALSDVSVVSCCQS
jgi:hypothetical protein